MNTDEIVFTDDVFKSRLAQANDKESIAQLAFEIIEDSLANRQKSKTLHSRFEKLLDKGLDINIPHKEYDGGSCIWGIQYGYTDYHLKTARLIFDRCGLPSVIDDGGETFFQWIEGKVMYNYFDSYFLVRLFLLCLSYMDSYDLIKFETNVYQKMLDGLYISSFDLRDGDGPLKLDLSFLRDYKNIDFCIEMEEQKQGYYGCWKMHIYHKKSRIKIATLG